MPVYIHKDGSWQLVDRMYAPAPVSKVMHEVLAAYVYTRSPPGTGPYGWRPIIDNFQEPARNVVGTSPQHTGGTLSWDAADRATHYQVREQGAPANKFPWITEQSYVLSGLLQDRTYTYTVAAGRGTAGGFLESKLPSNKRVLATGHPAKLRRNAAYPATQTVFVSAQKSDTWSRDQKWGQTAGDVVQGYAKFRERNAFGAVSYRTARSQVAAAIDYPATEIPAAAENTVDRVEITNALMDRAGRRAEHGTGTPLVEVRAWLVDFVNDPRESDLPGSQATFRAPEPGEPLDDFPILTPVTEPPTPRENKLVEWARMWIRPVRTHDGILMFRNEGTGNDTAGYNGYCRFQAANVFVTDWRLKLSVRWSFNYPTYLAPKWT